MLSYLCGMITHSILSPSASTMELQAYTDTDRTTDMIDYQSRTRLYNFLGDSLIPYISKMKDVPCSSAEV